MAISLSLVPLSIRRQLTATGDTSTIRTSRRFSDISAELCEKILKPGFQGYWICRGSVHGPQRPPSKSDITLVWLHGGAYVTGTALTGVVSLLRIAEIAAQNNLSVNVFSLEYSLAPEARFPTQMNEATAAYRYLVEEEKIDPESIMVLGESSGGHLALSLAYNLHGRGMPRPGKVVLISPWVNLDNSGSTFATNKYKDFLDKQDLDRCVEWLFGDTDTRLKFGDYVNFAARLPSKPTPDGHLNWSHVLPPTWVTIGGNDVFLADVSSFVENARADRVHVDLQVEAGKPHGWLGYGDAIRAREYLALSPGDDASSVLKGSEKLAEVVCDHARRSSKSA
ncbi:Alpha/Beta hydrolase protein [Aspergillus lucknowensis]|uniref:Alpha/Beta hydrolase protein n=1 Tax=Aspergillus lucknowensis TaxID=176173 RepID=A0ABR4LDB1_9EURO